MRDALDAHEAARLDVLASYGILDTPPHPPLDKLTAIAARVFDVPMACIGIVAADRIWLKSSVGMDLRDVQRSPGLCMSTLVHDDVYHLADASAHPEAREHPIVRGGVRFYAGAALETPDGFRLGTFCVLGPEPRGLTDDERASLRDFASLAMGEIERHRTSVDLVRAREAGHESDERFRVIFEQAAVGIAQVGLDGRWLNVNRRLCEIVGYERDELVDGTFQEITHPDDLGANLTDLNDALAGRIDSYTMEKRYVRKDGSDVWVNLAVALVRDSQGRPRYFISVVEDIDERKRAEEALRKTGEQLQHVQKLESLGVLAGGIAHDFNNLLVGVLGNAGIALTDLPESSPVYENVRMIEKAAVRAAELTNQMLAYSGKGSFVIESIDLNRLVAETRDLLAMAVAKNVLVRRDLAQEPLAVQGDRSQLQQVLMNLVTNASDAIGSEDGTVTIATGSLDADRAVLADTLLDDDLPPGRYAYFEVTDSGEGMDVHTVRRIFDPFFTTKFTGRGLGLAAVLGIVRAHKGAISIQTELGLGTSIRILLPATAVPAASSAAPASAAEAWRGHGTVLVVDDEDMVRAVASECLRRVGFEVVDARDGVEGVRRFAERAGEIVCVLLDLTMPRKGGEAAFEEIRAIDGDVPVVFSSGISGQELAERLATRPAVHFVKKPYTHEQLVAEVRSALAASSLA